MQLIRTTLRLKQNLKKEAERRALEEDTTLQDIFNLALKEYLEKTTTKHTKKIFFKTHNLGKPLDNLHRTDYYPNP